MEPEKPELTPEELEAKRKVIRERVARHRLKKRNAKQAAQAESETDEAYSARQFDAYRKQNPEQAKLLIERNNFVTGLSVEAAQLCGDHPDAADLVEVFTDVAADIEDFGSHRWPESEATNRPNPEETFSGDPNDVIGAFRFLGFHTRFDPETLFRLGEAIVAFEVANPKVIDAAVIEGAIKLYRGTGHWNPELDRRLRKYLGEPEPNESSGFKWVLCDDGKDSVQLPVALADEYERRGIRPFSPSQSKLLEAQREREPTAYEVLKKLEHMA